MWRLAVAARGAVRAGGLGLGQRRLASTEAANESQGLTLTVGQTLLPIPVVILGWVCFGPVTDTFDTRMPVEERKAIIYDYLKRTRETADRKVEISKLPSRFEPRAPCPSPGESTTNVKFGQ